MNKFIEELKRRNVIKSTIAYLVVAWVLLQVFQMLLPMVDAPDWALKSITIIMAIGLPVWIIVSWIYDITPQGIEKTAKDSGSELVTQVTNKRLNAFIIASLSIAVIVLTLKLTNVFEDSNKQYAIAVLPFHNINADEGFSDGITFDIYTYLAAVKSLKVISTKSTMKYKGTDKTISEIADELGVDFLVDGNVRKNNKRVLISASLINANDEQEWSEKYDESEEDPFKIQQAVSQKIVEELKIKLSPQEEEAIEKLPTENKQAYDKYKEGLGFSDKHTQEDFNKSIDLFQQVIDLDPNFAEAYVEIANSRFLLRQWIDKDKERDKYLENLNIGRQQINKALEIDSNSALAYAMKGSFLFWLNDGVDKEKSKEYYDKAYELNNNNPRVYFILSHYYYYKTPRDIEKCLYNINKAVELEHLSIDNNYYKVFYLLEDNKITEAESHYNKAIYLFTKEDKITLKNTILTRKAEQLSIQNKDWSEAINRYHREIEQDSNNSYLHRKLGEAYDEILNDDINYLKYTKKAYDLDSTVVEFSKIELRELVLMKDNLGSYLTALFENNKFKEADKLMRSIKYRNLISDEEKSEFQFHYYYDKENYQEAQKIIEKDLLPKDLWFVLLNYAQLGERKKVTDLLNEKEYNYPLKARVFAILKKKDSMYHYLERLDSHNAEIKGPNSQREFDPYRKEERYKALLRKHYLPITHWNE